MAYSIELREPMTLTGIKAQMISGDAGSVQRRALAERLAKSVGERGDFYVIERNTDTLETVAEYYLEVGYENA